jgi:hypothetical protein
MTADYCGLTLGGAPNEEFVGVSGPA